MGHNKIILTTLSLAIASLLTACGGGGGGSSSFQSKTLDGAVVDFYVTGATVSLDDCGITTTTAAKDGVLFPAFDFTTTASCQESAITVTGGTDTVTGLPFTGTLKSKKINFQNRTVNTTKPEIVLSPLTTLEFYAAEAGVSLNDLLNKAGLGNLIGEDFSSFDPQQDATDEEMAKIFIIQQLANIIGDNASSSAYEQIIDVLSNSSESLFTSTGELNQTIVTTLTDISTAAGLASIYESLTDALDDAANSGKSLAEIITDSPEIIDEIIEVVQPSAYTDILVAGKTLTELGASSTSPINLSKASLGTLLNVSFKASSTEVSSDSIQVAFKLNGVQNSKTKTLNVLVNQIDLTFNNGSLSSATIPAGTKITIDSTLYELEEAEFTLDNSVNLGSTINLNTLVQSHLTLQGFYDKYYSQLAAGTDIDAEVFVKSQKFSTTAVGLAPPSTVTVGSSSFSGESLKAYFKLIQ